MCRQYNEIKTNTSTKNSCLGIRHLQVSCMCLTIITMFIVRGCMSVAILAMTDNRRNDTSATLPVYHWDKNTQSLILSSFYWGYNILQIPAGILSKKFGGKAMLLTALMTNCVMCCLVPTFAALGGWPLVCVARLSMGLAQACLFSSTNTLLGQWLPPNEMTSYAGFVFGGGQIGTIIAMPLSGVLAETIYGWKLIFYVISIISLVNAALWYWFTASTPVEHRLISKEERQYIEDSLNTTSAAALGVRNIPTPWRHIFTAVPMWAILSTHIGSAMSFVLFFVDMPTYLEKGMQMSLKNSATFSALPYIGMWVGIIVSSIIAEKLNNRKVMSKTACRKLVNSIGMFGIAGGLIVLSFLQPENKILAVVTLIGTLTLSGFSDAGYLLNHLDLSPNFAGVMMSLTNFIASMGSVLTPIAISHILQNDSTDLSRWRLVFQVMAAVTAGTNIIYVLFGSSERQPWNDPEYLDKQNADPEEMKPVTTGQQENSKEADR